MKTFGIDLKVASKFFGQKFACGASITGDDEIVIQGDFKDDLWDLIPEKWPEVSILREIKFTMLQKLSNWSKGVKEDLKWVLRGLTDSKRGLKGS